MLLSDCQDVTWIGSPTAVEATALTVRKGHRAVAQATVKNHGETRGWGCPNLHHVIHQQSTLARGHDVWYSEQKARVPGLGGPSQKNYSGCPNVCGGPYQ